MELEFWIAIVLDVLAAVGLVYLARSRKAQPPLLKALTLALGLLFISLRRPTARTVSIRR